MSLEDPFLSTIWLKVKVYKKGYTTEAISNSETDITSDLSWYEDGFNMMLMDNTRSALPQSSLKPGQLTLDWLLFCF